MSEAQYSKLYHFVLSDKNLSPSEKLIVSVIGNYDNGKGHCTASYSTLAETCGITRRTAIQCVTHLEELGYIRRVTIGKHRQIIVSNLKKMSEEHSCSGENDEWCKNDTKVVKNSHQVVKKIHQSGENISPNKNIYKNNIKENNIKELRSQQTDILDFEKPLVHSMSDALDGLASYPDKLIRGRAVNDHFRNRMMYVAKSYADSYYKHYGKHHPYINSNDEFSPMQTAVVNFIDGDRSIIDLSDDDIDTTIDLFFKDNYFDSTDRHINVFASPNVWIRRVKEMERMTGKPGYYGIGVWQIEESEPDGWWTKDKMPDEWNECSKIAL